MHERENIVSRLHALSVAAEISAAPLDKKGWPPSQEMPPPKSDAYSACLTSCASVGGAE
jgi:hypothetical protein